MKSPTKSRAAKKRSSSIDPIESVLRDVRAGKPVIVVDDAERENEGDLILAGEKTTADSINFMVRYGRGMICAPITVERAAKLGLNRMVLDNRESFKTDFTVTVDAAEGVTTGISAADRARAVRILADPKSQPRDLVQPGHIFPLRAKAGGVLQRSGHTEAAVDLARLAGLDPSGVLCEIMKDDGTMARLPDLIRFKKKHKLKLCTILDLIEYRRRREKLIELEQRVKLPTDFGTFDLLLYRTTMSQEHHLALVKGDVADGQPVLVRVHSECLTGDVFGSRRCDCGSQLHTALRQIEQAGRGILLYMRQEGRGIGLAAKIHAYKLQEDGFDTVQANLKLGFPSDLREYGLGAQILFDLGVRQIRLLTNNPKKVVGLAGYGLCIVETVPIRIEANPHNKAYLRTKRTKMGHLI
ncbi:MAG: bifunctional 3,4-dihydroxy-2-butanone-4-phosphate synthase/GTP cyclohydrolase II [Methylacidiphilales bacterium]|nr:bifunctional 3,4-dihydroxy-2-butanone-4-phosphate synthase/GTP cyclohydrolase II [Candidatus Methylacidiphilales bacterium]